MEAGAGAGAGVGVGEEVEGVALLAGNARPIDGGCCLLDATCWSLEGVSPSLSPGRCARLPTEVLEPPDDLVLNWVRGPDSSFLAALEKDLVTELFQGGAALWARVVVAAATACQECSHRWGRARLLSQR